MRLNWIDLSEFIARVRLLEERGYIKSSNSTAVRDSKYYLLILEIGLYISEYIKE
jgi:hypothetical protein